MIKGHRIHPITQMPIAPQPDMLMSQAHPIPMSTAGAKVTRSYVASLFTARGMTHRTGQLASTLFSDTLRRTYDEGPRRSTDHVGARIHFLGDAGRSWSHQHVLRMETPGDDLGAALRGVPVQSPAHRILRQPRNEGCPDASGPAVLEANQEWRVGRRG